MKYSVLLEPAQTPAVTLAFFKTSLRHDNTAEDAYLETLLSAATEQAEEYLQRSLVRQKRLLAWPGSPPRAVKLDRGPVLSIDSVTYVKPDGTIGTLASNEYVLEGDVLYPALNTDWPACRTETEQSFRVVYYAGFVDDTVSPAQKVLSGVQAAIAMYGQLLYDKHAPSAELLTSSAQRLLDSFRAGQGV